MTSLHEILLLIKLLEALLLHAAAVGPAAAPAVVAAAVPQAPLHKRLAVPPALLLSPSSVP